MYIVVHQKHCSYRSHYPMGNTLVAGKAFNFICPPTGHHQNLTKRILEAGVWVYLTHSIAYRPGALVWLPVELCSLAVGFGFESVRSSSLGIRQSLINSHSYFIQIYDLYISNCEDVASSFIVV